MTYPPPPPGLPQFAAQPAPDGRKPRLRGRIPLRLALIFGVIGAAALTFGIVIIIRDFFDAADGFTRVAFDATPTTVQFTRTGDYVGYYETPSSGSHTALVHMTLTSASGVPVAVAIYGDNDGSSSTLTYTEGGHHGQALYTFHIDQAGYYRIALTSDSDTADVDMAFGKSIAGGLVKGVLLIIPGALLLVAAIVLFIVGLVRRSNHKKQLAWGGGYAGPPPGYGGYPQAPPPGFGGYPHGPPPGH